MGGSRAIMYDNPTSTATNSTSGDIIVNSTTTDGGLSSFITQFSEQEKSRDEETEQLLIESNLMIEDVKLLLDKMNRMMEYYYKRDVEQHNLPNDTDPKKVYFRDAYLHFEPAIVTGKQIGRAHV